MRLSLSIELAMALAFAGASAHTPRHTAQDSKAEEASMRGYADADKTCQEWTDGCITCQRSDAGEPVCPNIGIACQPKAITCTKRVEEKK